MKRNNGFTLVEIVVALGILSFVSVGVIYSISLSLTSAARIKNNLIASNLAQEGLEISRNIRDRDWHLGNNFGTSLPNGDYIIDWTSQALNPFSDVFLKVDGNGFYNYSSGQDSIFKRKITIEDSGQNPPAVERVIKVEVSWNEKSGPKSIQAELRLFNWQ